MDGYLVAWLVFFFFFNDTATTEIYTLSLHDALPIWRRCGPPSGRDRRAAPRSRPASHVVVARGAALPDGDRPGASQDHRPPRRGRLVVERRRPAARAGHGTRDGPSSSGRLRLRARAPVTLARSDRVRLRHVRVPSLHPIHSACRGRI